MFHLVSNAVKFTKQGKITIDVSLHDRQASPLLNISCQDKGIEIHPDRIEAIFEEFEQSDNTTTREYGGSGLGLAIV